MPLSLCRTDSRLLIIEEMFSFSLEFTAQRLINCFRRNTHSGFALFIVSTSCSAADVTRLGEEGSCDGVGCIFSFDVTIPTKQ